eukprot:6212300-Pleurochrysis_carterae.AAC.1
MASQSRLALAGIVAAILVIAAVAAASAMLKGSRREQELELSVHRLREELIRAKAQACSSGAPNLSTNAQICLYRVGLPVTGIVALPVESMNARTQFGCGFGLSESFPTSPARSDCLAGKAAGNCMRPGTAWAASVSFGAHAYPLRGGRRGRQRRCWGSICVHGQQRAAASRGLADDDVCDRRRARAAAQLGRARAEAQAAAARRGHGQAGGCSSRRDRVHPPECG